MNTIELIFDISGEARELLLARLINAGCEAFEETDSALLAYLPQDSYNAAAIQSIAQEFGVAAAEGIIAPQNWNAAWESSFEPVVVPGFCTVRAAFHPPAPDTPHEIIVTPKMSFGTGHHATTRLMMTAMKDLDFSGKAVLDFGTGTGILAILASRLGARLISAIDIDVWSAENALENTLANGIHNVLITQGSLEVAGGHAPFGVVLANINRHILLQYMMQMRQMLEADGTLLLSGILTTDEAIIRQSARNAGLKYITTLTEGDWIAIIFTAQSSPFLAN